MSTLQLKIVPINESLSLKARTYEALKAAITNLNIYDPGAELKLDERDLSERFGVSRTPLREALAQLESEGLVKIVARRGIYIVRKTKSEILDMITVWAALESMAARLATTEATDVELKSLHEHIDAFSADAVARNMGEYSDANIRFHQTIIGIGGCPLISKLAKNYSSTFAPSATGRLASRTGPSARSLITSKLWRRLRCGTRTGRGPASRCRR